MRVLHLGKFYPPVRGGIENHVETLCRELAKTIAVEVLVANRTREYRSETVDGVQIRRLERVVDLAGAPICRRLVREIRHSSADLIHLHAPNPYAMLALLMSRSHAPLITTWHSDIVRQRWLAKLFAPFERRVVRLSNRLIASSSTYLETSPTLAPNRARCRVIPYGIHAAELQIPDARRVSELRARFGPQIVLGVGRLVYYKGFEHLIGAIAEAPGHLLIVGDGPLRSSLQDFAISAGVADRISFLGDLPRSDLIACYHAADIFVLPSIARSEAFGIVQLEAMACGKPVINARIDSGVPFVSRDGETGITVQPGDARQLACAIQLLFDNAELAARYGAAGRRRVADHFNAATMAAQTLELYREVLALAAADQRDETAHEGH